MITRIPVNPRYPKFHRLSRRDANQMKSGFRIRSGLYEDQIAVSAWGFPPVPKRFPRQRNGLIRNAPSNVNADFVGHPIYWFDEDLAGRIQYGEQYQESEGAWSIRMHYLMQVTGYKKKTYKADDHFDFLKVRRFDDWNTLEQYHCPSLPEIWLDSSPQYRLIGRQDLTDKEHATWTSLTESAVERCQEVADGLDEDLAYRYRDSLTVVENSLRPCFDSNTYWSNHVQPALDDLSMQYERQFANLRKPIWGHLSRLSLAEFRQLEDLILLYRDCARQYRQHQTHSFGPARPSTPELATNLHSVLDFEAGVFDCFDNRVRGSMDRLVATARAVHDQEWSALRSAHASRRGSLICNIAHTGEEIILPADIHEKLQLKDAS